MNLVNYLSKNKYELSIGQKFTLLFCFLGALNFIDRYFYWFTIAFIVLLVFNKLTLPRNMTVFCLFVFGLCILIFSKLSHLSITSLIKPFIFFLCYIVGYNLIDLLQNQKKGVWNRHVQLLIILLAAGCMLHFLLNWSINYDATTRNPDDFWTGQILSATGQMCFACYAIGVSCAMLFSNRKTIYKVLSVLTLISVLGYNMVLAGRTILVMIVIVLITAALFYFVFNRSTKKIRIFVAVLMLILILIVLYNDNFLGVKTTFENSNLYYRFFDASSISEFDDDIRMYLKGRYIDHLLEYPFGGNKIYSI